MSVACEDGCVEVRDGLEDGFAEVDELGVPKVEDHHFVRVDGVLAEPVGVGGEVLGGDD